MHKFLTCNGPQFGMDRVQISCAAFVNYVVESEEKFAYDILEYPAFITNLSQIKVVFVCMRAKEDAGRNGSQTTSGAHTLRDRHKRCHTGTASCPVTCTQYAIIVTGQTAAPVWCL